MMNMFKDARKSFVAVTMAVLVSVLALAPMAVFAADDYPSKYKNAPLDALVDEWNYYNRECTSFVAWRLNNTNGVAFHNRYGGINFGNANTWANAARAIGITVDNTPAVGSVAQTSSGVYGHVAWVSAVSGDNVTIEEYNWGTAGAYGTRTVNKSTFVYIHIKDLPPPVKFDTWPAKSEFTTDENVVINWNSYPGAAHYGITVRDADTMAKVYEDYHTGNTVNIGKLAAGNYRFAMAPYASGQYENYLTLSEVKYFTVTAAPKTYPKVTYDGHQYQAFDETMTWTQAKAKAESLGGHLVTITSSGENAFIASMFAQRSWEYYWIGATDEALTGSWKWVTGETFSYAAWNPGEPNNAGGVEHYAHFIVSSSKWNDLENVITTNIGYIVEWEPVTPTPSPSPSSALLIKVNSTTGAPQANVRVVISTENVQSIGSFGFRVNYNSSKLTFVSAEKGSTISNFGTFESNAISSGVLSVGGMGTTSTAQSGELVILTFKVTASGGESLPITLSNLDFANNSGANVSCTAQNGVITVSSVMLGDVNGDTNITTADAMLAFRGALGVITLTESQKAAADLDGNGTVTTGEAMRIFRYALGVNSVL